MQIGFTILYVNDLQKAKKFYTEIIGLPVIEAKSGPQFITLGMTEGSPLALEDVAISPISPTSTPRNAEIAFLVDDVDAVWHRWKECGVEIVRELENKPFGRTFMAKDPDGYFLMVYQPPHTS